MKAGKVNEARPACFPSTCTASEWIVPLYVHPRFRRAIDLEAIGLYNMRNTPFIDCKLVYGFQTHSHHTSSFCFVDRSASAS